MSKIRDDAFLSFWEKYGAGAHTDSFMHGWRAALDAAANKCADMPRVAEMLTNPELEWPPFGPRCPACGEPAHGCCTKCNAPHQCVRPGKTQASCDCDELDALNLRMSELAAERKPQADDDPNDCHDWTPKGM